MIYNVSGKLTHTGANFAVVSCGGVGFKCNTTLNTLKNIGKVGTDVNLFTYLNVREDALELFGFSSEEELDCFKLLISVNGIGPKAAISILSELTPDKLALCIASGDSKALTKAQGVGKKIAERAVLELKDKIQGVVAMSAATVSDISSVASVANNTAAQEAVEALVALGFNQSEASLAVSKLDSTLSVDEMIRKGLSALTRQV